MTATLDRLASSWDTAMQPRSRPRSLLAFAESLTVGESSAGPERLVLTPIQRAIAQALDHGWLRVVIAGSVQSGKTLLGCVVPALYQIAEDCRPVMIAAPTVELAAALWRGKGEPMLRLSGLGHLLPSEGGGSRRGTADEFLCATGCRVYLRGAGGANESQQAFATVRTVVVTEADSIAISKRTVRRNGERPGRRVLDLLDRRRHRFGADSRMVIESTVKQDRDSLILDLWAEGTAGTVLHPCPHCRAWTPRSWDAVTYDPTDADTAAASVRCACPACGVALTPVELTDGARRAQVIHRGQTIVGGQITGPMPPCETWSIRYTALDDPGTDLVGLVHRHRLAVLALRERQDAAPIRQFWRDYLTTGYDGEGADSADTRRPPEAIALAKRSAAATYAAGTIPFPGQLSFAIDQQERELWWLALVTDGQRRAIIDAGVDYFCHRHETPTADQRRAALDRCRDRAEALGVPVDACGVDAGGRGYLDVLDPWLRATGWAWWAVRGDGRDVRGDGAGIDRLPGWYETFRRDDGRNLLLAEAATIKDGILVGLSAATDSPVAIHLPQGLAADSHLIRHLIAEAKIDGKWVKLHARNDQFDNLVYASALARRAAQRAGITADLIVVGGGAA
jgi:phage terminase large subunit GpA-like protein